MERELSQISGGKIYFEGKQNVRIAMSMKSLTSISRQAVHGGQYPFAFIVLKHPCRVNGLDNTS